MTGMIVFYRVIATLLLFSIGLAIGLFLPKKVHDHLVMRILIGIMIELGFLLIFVLMYQMISLIIV